MYMNPTFPVGGGWCPIQAFAHSIAFASKHIGSGPGVAGLSGMQVHPSVPLPSVRIVPTDAIVPTVASSATLAGATFLALVTSLPSIDFGAENILVAAPRERINKHIILKYLASIKSSSLLLC